MNAAVLGVGGLILFVLAYRFYARYLQDKVFQLPDNNKTPAHELEDGIDYVPTNKKVLFGHHYSSIAGAAPIVGPAVAVIWGWVPAVLWVILGVIFMGACHDFGCLVLSMQHRGESMGQLAEKIMGRRVRNLFLLVIFFLVWLVIAVFALVIANLFIQFPGSVIPINFEIAIALVMGFLINKKKIDLTIPSILAQIGLLVMIWVGTKYPISLEPLFGDQTVMAWIVFLLVYSFIASILPVWVLLQPRDYINGHQLFLGLTLMILGLIVTQPEIVAPAINPNPEGAPSWFPFLFITIACGAISGFHGLVSSGTTSKQVKNWRDARPIAYGGMLGEGLLALLATLAVTAGFSSSEQWHAHYGSWSAANGLSAKIGAFVMGASSFISGLGIPQDFAQVVIAVLIISFAATSLDTAGRIQRYVIGEIGSGLNLPVLKNRFVGAGLAMASALILILAKDGGKGGLFLWPLFGATNQMLAGLSLIVICVYLYKLKRPTLSFALPCFFILLMTGISLVMNINVYVSSQNWFLTSLAVLLFLAQIWIIVEGVMAVRRRQSP